MLEDAAALTPRRQSFSIKSEQHDRLQQQQQQRPMEPRRRRTTWRWRRTKSMRVAHAGRALQRRASAPWQRGRRPQRACWVVRGGPLPSQSCVRTAWRRQSTAASAPRGIQPKTNSGDARVAAMPRSKATVRPVRCRRPAQQQQQVGDGAEGGWDGRVTRTRDVVRVGQSRVTSLCLLNQRKRRRRPLLIRISSTRWLQKRAALGRAGGTRGEMR